MQIRYFLLAVCLCLVGYSGLILLQDLVYIDTAVSSIHRTVSTAAEQALAQVVASDELFNNGSNGNVYNATGITTIYTADSTDTEYTKKNLFDFVYKTDDKDTLYRYMYGPDSLFNDAAYVSEVCKVTNNIGNFEVPILARMGLLDPTYNLIPQAQAVLQKQLDDSGYTASISKFQNDWLGTRSVQKEFVDAHGKVFKYYLAPTNIGITYIDANLLQTAFATNMDLLMRAKFVDEIGAESAVGIAQGAGLPTLMMQGADFVVTDDAQATLDRYNVINNGLFGYVKGEYKVQTVGTGYTGGITVAGTDVKPVIRYKVINVCDETNAAIVRLAVSDVAGPYGETTYREWLESIGINPDEPHYCVIAQVTFYADIIIPYGTELTRNLYSLYVRETTDSANDFFAASVVNETASDETTSALTGNTLYAYTTYYAIMP